MKMNPSDPNPRRDGEEPTAPAKLVAALKEPPSRRAFVPRSVDAAVLHAARQHFAQPARTRLSLFRSWLAWPAVATSAVVLLGFGYFWFRQDESTRFAREDINRDGRVDILDAFQLARETQSGSQSEARDLNGDGVVDHRDAEFIATRVVSLEKGGKS